MCADTQQQTSKTPTAINNKPESASLDINKLGMGLSRWLRYSYRGFLLVFLLLFFDKKVFLKEVIESLKAPLALVALIVIGAGIYTVHRRFIIPVHHFLAIKFHKFCERKKAKENSMNPVVWLLSIGVRKGYGIIAYSYLRKTDVFEKRGDLNVEHAELGLLIMTGEALFVAGIGDIVKKSITEGVVLIVLGAAFFFLSMIPDMVLHATECRELRAKKDDVKDELEKVGLLKN